jgi:glycosyltransferase involved in cell wall biosynthesis
MPDRARLALVVPCFNEAQRLDRPAFDEALRTMPWLDLCFVDDGSTDATAARLHDIEQAWPGRVRVVVLPTNRGKAEAVRTGLLTVSATAGYCGFWDADLAAPLAEVATLREVFQRQPQAEWVWGIRLRALGRHITRRPLRHYLGRLFASAASILLGIDSYDTQCGAKLFRVTPLLHTALSEPFRSRWIFDVELLSRADAILRHDAQRAVATVVYEQPLAVWEHKAGSKVKPTDFLRALQELWMVRGERAHWARALVTGTPTSST